MDACHGMLEFSVHANTCIPSPIFRQNSTANGDECAIVVYVNLILGCFCMTYMLVVEEDASE